jgi:hypothetical protein
MLDYAITLGYLNEVAAGQSGAAIARDALRKAIPGYFPDAPTVAAIKATTDSEAWQDFDGKARRIFAVAWTTAPRMVKFAADGEAESYTPTGSDLDLWVADKATAKAYDPRQTAIRKAMQAYVRVSVKQNIADFIPEAIDAVEADKAPALPDPVKVLAMVDAALVILSEHDNKAALALLNGLDALVTVCRKPLSEGKALKAKA